MLGPVSTWMDDRLRMGKPSLYVTSHPGQLSLPSSVIFVNENEKDQQFVHENEN